MASTMSGSADSLDVSIILPTFNEAENIPRIVPALAKALGQEGLEGEIIVVDDDSPDGTARIAEGLSGSYPVRVHLRKNA